MPSVEPKGEHRIRELFYASIVLKGLNALLEAVLGVALIFSSRYTEVLQALIGNELVEDPGDFLARHADQFSPYLTAHFEIYGGLYLLTHGVVKGFIVWGLLRNKLWAYPAGLAVFALFIAYQLVKWSQTHSVVLLGLTIFDLFVMWLIWHEYRQVQRKAA